MSREKTLVKNTAILGVGALFSKGLVFLMIPFFSKWLSVEDYGLFDLFSTYITLLIPFLTLSTGEAVFRFLIDEADNKENQSSIISNGYCIFLIGSLITLICCGFYFYCSEPALMIPFCSFLFAESLNNYTLTYLRGIRKLTQYTICNILSMVGIAVFVTVFVFFLEYGLEGMLYGYCLGYLLSSIFVLCSTKCWQYWDSRTLSRTEMKKLIKYSAPLIPNSISWWIVNASDRSIINIFLGSAANGVYAISHKVPSLCTTLFSVFHISWQENASMAINDDDRDRYFSSILENLTKVLVSICIIVISLDFLLFYYVFDEKYFNGMMYVPILIAACFFTIISQFFGGIFIGLKEPKYNGGTTIVAAIVNIVAHLILIRYIGLFAASCSTLISFLVLCFIRYILIRKRFALHFSKKFYLYLGIFAYFIFIHYLDIMLLNWMNIVISLSCFAILNKAMIRKMLNKITIKNKR